MRARLHWYAIGLFLIVLAYDCIVWGAASRLPDVGPHLLASAQGEAPLVYSYMRVGSVMDQAVPALDSWGQRHASAALSEGFARINDNPRVAMDLVFSRTWNSQHATLKTMHWAAPVLAVISLVLWLRRPKKVALIGRRR
jgi:hypothetical protein